MTMPNANGAHLFSLLPTEKSHTQEQQRALFALTQFNLPYFEGLNRYDNKYWLGILPPG
jgi:hypothetical protein